MVSKIGIAITGGRVRSFLKAKTIIVWTICASARTTEPCVGCGIGVDSMRAEGMWARWHIVVARTKRGICGVSPGILGVRHGRILYDPSGAQNT